MIFIALERSKKNLHSIKKMEEYAKKLFLDYVYLQI